MHDGTLSANVVSFLRALRERDAFAVGPGHTIEALRALEHTGSGDPVRFRCALRLICCASPEEIAVFDEAFDRFFFGPQRLPQPRPSRSQRLSPLRAPMPQGAARPAERQTPTGHEDESEEQFAAQDRRYTGEIQDAAAWQRLRAKYSPDSESASALVVTRDDDDLLARAAARLIASVRAGRSRLLRPQSRGAAIDVPRTLRASLRTAGDPATLRRLGRPPRNPRFLVFLDGSRSMVEHAALPVAFAAALAQRSRRANVWVFSTGIREVTRSLRSMSGSGANAIESLGGAWGGGTRIGSSILDVVRAEGPRLLGPDATVLICSDGLDAGDLDALERALREMRSRGAAVVWLHPYAGTPGFRPASRALRRALPYLTALLPARETADFTELSARLASARRGGRAR